jgi:hypothetical protein
MRRSLRSGERGRIPGLSSPPKVRVVVRVEGDGDRLDEREHALAGGRANRLLRAEGILSGALLEVEVHLIEKHPEVESACERVGPESSGVDRRNAVGLPQERGATRRDRNIPFGFGRPPPRRSLRAGPEARRAAGEARWRRSLPASRRFTATRSGEENSWWYRPTPGPMQPGAPPSGATARTSSLPPSNAGAEPGRISPPRGALVTRNSR